MPTWPLGIPLVIHNVHTYTAECTFVATGRSPKWLYINKNYSKKATLEEIPSTDAQEPNNYQFSKLLLTRIDEVLCLKALLCTSSHSALLITLQQQLPLMNCLCQSGKDPPSSQCPPSFQVYNARLSIDQSPGTTNKVHTSIYPMDLMLCQWLSNTFTHRHSSHHEPAVTWQYSPSISQTLDIRYDNPKFSEDVHYSLLRCETYSDFQKWPNVLHFLIVAWITFDWQQV